jgi:hypothetical protein
MGVLRIGDTPVLIVCLNAEGLLLLRSTSVRLTHPSGGRSAQDGFAWHSSRLPRYPSFAFSVELPVCLSHWRPYDF